LLQSPSTIRNLLIIIGLTVAVRGLAILMTADAFDADPDAYQAIAQTISGSGVFGLTSPEGVARPTAFRPPLYPWLLSLCVSDGRLSHSLVSIFHLLLSALTAGLVFFATRRLAKSLSLTCGLLSGDTLGFTAAGLTAIDPILLRQSTAVMTETLAATLTAAVILLWCIWADPNERKNTLWFPAALGVFLALAYLCRPTFLVWAILLVAAIVVESRRRRGFRSAAIAAGIVAIAVGGWTLRNVKALGHPIWATTHGGYTLLLGNNESFYRYLSQGRFGQAWDADEFLNAYRHRYDGDPREAAFWNRDWTAPPNNASRVSEHEDDRLCYRSAVATIKRQPGRFVWSALVRVARLWSPFPHDIAGRSAAAITMVSCFYLALYTAVLISIDRLRGLLLTRQWWAIWLLAITLTGVHAVYWSNLRMRAPAIPALAILASLSLCRPGAEPERNEGVTAGSS
jgi:hypothetical protein